MSYLTDRVEVEEDKFYCHAILLYQLSIVQYNSMREIYSFLSLICNKIANKKPQKCLQCNFYNINYTRLCRFIVKEWTVCAKQVKLIQV